MSILKDKSNNRAYKLLGEVLFETPLYNDNSINNSSWRSVDLNYSPYQLDIIKKLKEINQIIYSTNKGIIDDFN